MASAKQLQHLVFLYQRYFPLAPPTIALNGPIFVAATALTQIRRPSNAALTFETLLWLFADLAVSFCSLRDLMSTLLMIGYRAGFLDDDRFRFVFDRLSNAYDADHGERGKSKSIRAVDASEARDLTTPSRKDRSYDTHLAASARPVIDELEHDEAQ